MKRAFFFLVIFVSTLTGFAQTLPLMVQLDKNNLPYLNHQAGPKENYYSIGRIYNISPKVYVPYNGLELTTAISIGQQLKIPLNEINFWQTGTRKENESIIPVYYQVKPGETLTKLSQLFKTDHASIRSWNNLTADALTVGGKVIIGFLKVDKALSTLAEHGMNVRSEPTIVKQKPVEVKKQEPVKQEPVVVKKEEPKQEPVVKKEDPKIVPVKQEPVIKKEEPKTEVSTVVYSGLGHFKEEFNKQTNNGKQVNSNSGEGSIFKSTSGWSDGRYYVLMDSVEKGTIVMIKNPSNGKAVYAKVLSSVEETSPGSGLLFRLSNSAAAQLGINAEKFNADLFWGK